MQEGIETISSSEENNPFLLTTSEVEDLEHSTMVRNWKDYWLEKYPEVTANLKTKKFQLYVAARIRELSLKKTLSESYDQLAEVDSAVLSTQEELDLEYPSTRKGWQEYWLYRVIHDEKISVADDVSEKLNLGAKGIDDIGEPLMRFVKNYLRELNFKKQKQEAMQKMREELKAIDAGKAPESHAGRPQLSYDEEKGLFEITEGDSSIYLTKGDVLADGIWGKRYGVSDDVPRAQRRLMQKTIVVQETKTAVADTYDRELAAKYQISLPTTSISPEYLEENPSKGAIAERIAQSLLTRIQYQSPTLQLKVEACNALEDVVLKYDFKVQVLSSNQGVALAEDEAGRENYVKEKKLYGIQFTINKRAGMVKKKKKQIKNAQTLVETGQYAHINKTNVDEIVLVVVSLNVCATAFSKWLKNGKPAGGPEQYLSKGVKERLVRGVLGQRVNDETLATILESL